MIFGQIALKHPSLSSTADAIKRIQERAFLFMKQLLLSWKEAIIYFRKEIKRLNELPRCKQAGYQKLKEIWNRSKLRGIKPTVWD